MSNTGNFYGVYQLVQRVAEMVDQVLLNTSDQKTNIQLGQLLIDIASEDKTNRRARFLGMALLWKDKADQNKWADVGKALLQNKVGEEERGFLEQLARTLEQEQYYSFARMRGDI